ncbi:MAG: hypothetical protein LBU32_02420 [Clostridiales bacterium]|nr:hypothetical protein [Clostridiales bacterium]
MWAKSLIVISHYMYNQAPKKVILYEKQYIMATVFCLSNDKGGCAKSFTAASLNVYM